MRTSLRLVTGVAASVVVGVGIASAQTPDTGAGGGMGGFGPAPASGSGSGSGSDSSAPAAPTAPTAPTAPIDTAMGGLAAPPADAPDPDDPNASGKLAVGGGLRFPSGPDAMGKYAAFNWVALDLKARYNPTSFTALYITAPLAVKHPDIPDPASPSMFGGITARAEIGKPFLGLFATIGYMKERSFFYSDKMFPYYTGDYEPAFAIGPYINVKHWGLYFESRPMLAYQKAGSIKDANGDGDGGAQLALPVSAAVHLGSLLEVAADLGLSTGYGLSFDASKLGNIYAGASVTVKVKPVKVHFGTGVAALFTGSTGDPYPSVGDSVYFDLNVAYVK